MRTRCREHWPNLDHNVAPCVNHHHNYANGQDGCRWFIADVEVLIKGIWLNLFIQHLGRKVILTVDWLAENLQRWHQLQLVYRRPPSVNKKIGFQNRRLGLTWCKGAGYVVTILHFLLLCLSRPAPEFRFKPPLPLPGDWDKSLPPPLGGCRTLVLGEHNMQGATCKGLFIIDFIIGKTGGGAV